MQSDFIIKTIVTGPDIQRVIGKTENFLNLRMMHKPTEFTLMEMIFMWQGHSPMCLLNTRMLLEKWRPGGFTKLKQKKNTCLYFFQAFNGIILRTFSVLTRTYFVRTRTARKPQRTI